MRPQTRYKFKQLGVVWIFWFLIGLFFAIYDPIVFDYATASYVFFIPENQSFIGHILLNLTPPFFGGLIGGTLMIFYLRDKFKGYSYGRLLALHGLTYLFFILVVAVLVIFVNSSILLENTPWSGSVLNRATSLLTDIGLWKVIVFWFFVVIFTAFSLEVNDKYGPGILKKFITGSYHEPREEFRMFMFLDLKESTSIAEKIGSKNYFLLLKAFFDDVTEPILNSRGEIYQYVGDEITVSWKLNKRVNAKACLDCFFGIKDLMIEKNWEYTERFGVLPNFKAGIHYGVVTSGEIGKIKKEIVYSGDVLNTAARLMEACKKYDTEILISAPVISQIQSKRYQFCEVTEAQLRGKRQKLKIYTVTSA